MTEPRAAYLAEHGRTESIPVRSRLRDDVIVAVLHQCQQQGRSYTKALVADVLAAADRVGFAFTWLDPCGMTLLEAQRRDSEIVARALTVLFSFVGLPRPVAGDSGAASPSSSGEGGEAQPCSIDRSAA